jgi:hypothetical protein
MGPPSAAFVWGSTAEERRRAFPCDRLLPDADHVLFRAVDVDAPPGIVFRWLCQLRVAPYSYDWIDNLGRRSPEQLTPGLERLEVGQRCMTMFELVEFQRDAHLTVELRMPSRLARLGQLAASYVVVPRGAHGSRLVVKLLARYARGPLGAAMRALLPWADLVMMRKQLLTLRRLAEAQASDGGA